MVDNEEYLAHADEKREITNSPAMKSELSPEGGGTDTSTSKQSRQLARISRIRLRVTLIALALIGLVGSILLDSADAFTQRNPSTVSLISSVLGAPILAIIAVEVFNRLENTWRKREFIDGKRRFISESVIPKLRSLTRMLDSVWPIKNVDTFDDDLKEFLDCHKMLSSLQSQRYLANPLQNRLGKVTRAVAAKTVPTGVESSRWIVLEAISRVDPLRAWDHRPEIADQADNLRICAEDYISAIDHNFSHTGFTEAVHALANKNFSWHDDENAFVLEHDGSTIYHRPHDIVTKGLAYQSQLLEARRLQASCHVMIGVLERIIEPD